MSKPCLKYIYKAGIWPTGRPRWYFRKPGRKLVPLPDFPTHHKEFLRAYSEAETSGKALPSAHQQLIRRFATAALKRARSRARTKSIEIDVNLKDVTQMLEKQSYKCAVSGIKFTDERVGSSPRMPFAPSIDRIDPSRGYLKGNVRLVCTIVNLAIADFGDEIFLRMCKRASTQQERKLTTFRTLTTCRMHGFENKE